MATEPLSQKKKRIYTAIGVFFVVLGIAGTLLPIVPGTAFLIVAVVFFARSSETFHYWLLYNRFFGKHLRGYPPSGAPLLELRDVETAMSKPRSSAAGRSPRASASRARSRPGSPRSAQMGADSPTALLSSPSAVAGQSLARVPFPIADGSSADWLTAPR